jgi:hypothetical protein
MTLRIPVEDGQVHIGRSLIDIPIGSAGSEDAMNNVRLGM